MGGRAEDAVKWALLAAALVLAAFLRFDRLGAPSYWLDEILSDRLTTSAASAPWWRWITGLADQNGPLYYATQLATRLGGHGEAAGRAAEALFGVATVLVMFAATRGNAAAALLLAVSPLHVYYSREARPYALLMLWTALLLLELVRPLPRIGVAAALIVAMIYTTAVAAPLLAAVALTLAITRGRRELAIAAVAVVAIAAGGWIYGTRPPPAPGTSVEPIALHLAAIVLRSLTVSAFGDGGRALTIAGLLLFAIAGAVVLAKRDRRAATIVIGMTILPIVCAVVALTAVGHWFAPRYISPALIGFIVLAGTGIGAIGRREWIAMAIAALAAADTWRAARSEPFQKLDWRAIAATLEQHVRPGDSILTAEAWSAVCLRYYLRNVPPQVRVTGPEGIGIADILARSSKAAWLVTAGTSGDTSVREWMCRYPVLVAAPLEGFRLHYAPSAEHFVLERARAEDLRAFSAALGVHHVTIHPSDFLFGEGWAGSEGDIRWAAAKEATLRIPRFGRAPRRIVVHAMPFAHPTLPPQTMRVSLNGSVLGQASMLPGWRDYEFDAPLWRDGWNTISFAFARINAPSDFGAADRRTLAAAFDRIDVQDGNAPAEKTSFSVHLASDIRSGRHSRHTRYPAGQLNRDKVEALLGRLGYDPQTAWPLLEDAAASVAFESGCLDDRAFLDHAFDVIVQRPPNIGEETDLLAKLRAKTPRVEIVNRIMRAGDLRARLLKPPSS